MKYATLLAAALSTILAAPVFGQYDEGRKPSRVQYGGVIADSAVTGTYYDFEFNGKGLDGVKKKKLTDRNGRKCRSCYETIFAEDLIGNPLVEDPKYRPQLPGDDVKFLPRQELINNNPEYPNIVKQVTEDARQAKVVK